MDGRRTAQRDRASIRRISRSADLFFAQTNGGSIHTYDAETGRLSGRQTWGEARRRPVPSRRTPTWFSAPAPTSQCPGSEDRPENLDTHLGTIPTSGTVADEDRVMVGTMDGKVIGFSLRTKGPEGEPSSGPRRWRNSAGRPAVRSTRFRCPPSTWLRSVRPTAAFTWR